MAESLTWNNRTRLPFIHSPSIIFHPPPPRVKNVSSGFFLDAISLAWNSPLNPECLASPGLSVTELLWHVIAR